MRGRKPIPSKIVALLGGSKRTHRPPRNDEPEVESRMPPCPSHLTPVARKEWRRAGKQLLAVKILTPLDMAVLAGYCQAWAEWVAATDGVSKSGLLIKSPYGPKLNPLIRIARDAFDRMMRAGLELGLSPVSRTRVKVDKPQQPGKVAEFLRRKRGA